MLEDSGIVAANPGPNEHTGFPEPVAVRLAIELGIGPDENDKGTSPMRENLDRQ